LVIRAFFPKLSDYDVRIKGISKAKVNVDYIYGSAMEEEKEAIFLVHIAESDLSKIEGSMKDL